MEGATVVLSSATPSLESFTIARAANTLLEMLERVDIKMPHVRVVDLRQAARAGKGPPIFSPQLKEAMTQRLERKEQSILFLNRRGFSTSLQCPLCGYVAQCPECSVSLTYHRKDQKLCCHVCGHTENVPTVCPGALMPGRHSLLRSRHGKSGGHAHQIISRRAHQAHGFRHVEAEGRLPPHPGRFPRRKNRRPGRHANDR